MKIRLILCALLYAARASAITIDDFTHAATTLQPPGVGRATAGSTTVTDTGLAGVIGGTRTLTVTQTSTAKAYTGAGVVPSAGLLSYYSSATADGSFELLYDGNGAGLDADFSGKTGIQVVVLDADQASPPYDVTVSVVYGPLHASSLLQTITTSGPKTLHFAFTLGSQEDVYSVKVKVDPKQAADLLLGKIDTYPDDPTATPTSTPSATPVPATPTTTSAAPTGTPTQSPAATVTGVPPTPTDTPTNTATNTNTPTNTPTNTSTSIPTTTPTVDPVTCGAFPSQNTLSWPPNHTFSVVTIQGVTGAVITGVFQDEPVTGLGSGDGCPDAIGIGTATTSLRNERDGKSSADGRVYHVTFNVLLGTLICHGTVTVCVQHDQNVPCVDEGSLYVSTGPCSVRHL